MLRPVVDDRRKAGSTMSKPKVYIESSVVSYFTAAPSRDLLAAARQQITYEWWHTALPQCEAYISQVVLDEIAKGDRGQAERRLGVVTDFVVLDVGPNVRSLSARYFRDLALPKKAAADAFHLALATWHGMDYLVSWNCTHIASGRVRGILARVNAEIGVTTPVICTPEELMEV
jgi:hypothetical protein